MSLTNIESREKAFPAKLPLIVAAGLLIGVNSHAATITAATLEAWDDYVQKAEAALPQEAADDSHLFVFLQHSSDVQEQFRPGISAYSPHGSGIPVHSGLVHHWIGTVFLPKASAAEVLSVMQRYDQYSTIYAPGVVESKLLSRSGDEFTYRLKFIQKGFGVKAGLIGEFHSVYHTLTPGAGYSVTRSTELTELADPGTEDEHAVAFSKSHGYVERVCTIVRYRQVGQGVYVEVEALTLSRGVPGAVRWLVAPLIERFSRETMTATLERFKAGVQTALAQEAAKSDNASANTAPAQ